MRCQQMRPGTSTATIAAGEELGFVAMDQITHFGPVQFYMARVPDSANVNTWEAAGNVWFKAASISAVAGAGGLTSDEKTWPAYSEFLCSVAKYLVLVSAVLIILLSQRNRKSASRSPSRFLAATISSESRVSRCIRLKAWAELRSIYLAPRLRLPMAGAERPVHWSHFLERTSRAIRVSCGRTIPCGRVMRPLAPRSGKGKSTHPLRLGKRRAEGLTGLREYLVASILRHGHLDEHLRTIELVRLMHNDPWSSNQARLGCYQGCDWFREISGFKPDYQSIWRPNS